MGLPWDCHGIIGLPSVLTAESPLDLPWTPAVLPFQWDFHGVTAIRFSHGSSVHRYAVSVGSYVGALSAGKHAVVSLVWATRSVLYLSVKLPFRQNCWSVCGVFCRPKGRTVGTFGRTDGRPVRRSVGSSAIRPFGVLSVSKHTVGLVLSVGRCFIRR